MNTLQYGLQLPANGDLGTVIFPAMQQNISQIDAHTHDGITSSILPRSSVTSTRQAITAAGWALVANGIYRQSITIPAGFTYDDYPISFRLAASGHQFFPTIEKITNTTYWLYSNDASITVTALYG